MYNNKNGYRELRVNIYCKILEYNNLIDRLKNDKELSMFISPWDYQLEIKKFMEDNKEKESNFQALPSLEQTLQRFEDLLNSENKEDKEATNG